MSDNRTFERAARAWIEQGPATAPQRAVDAALRTIAITPQQRSLRVPRRFHPMLTPIRLAAAAAIVAVVIAGGFLFLGRAPAVGRSTPVPTSSSPAAVASPPSDDFQIGSGWLIFERGHAASPAVGSDLAIWAVRQDGTGLHEIAPEIDGKQSPDISPDGLNVAFETAGNALRAGGGESQIWQAPIDGRPASVIGQACLGGRACNDTDPAYSPDGTGIAFVRNGDRIAYADLRTGVVTELSATEVQSGIDPDGITEVVANVARPTWSRNGEIAYQHTIKTGDVSEVSVLIVNSDNTYRHPLPMPADLTAGDPHWSPDGTRILVSAVLDRYDTAPASVALYTAMSSGTEFKQLCAGAACGIDASWTPADNAILFWRDGTWWAMDASSNHQRPINPGLDVLSSAQDGAFVFRLQPDSAGVSLQP